jgi:hypothetical protein
MASGLLRVVPAHQQRCCCVFELCACHYGLCAFHVRHMACQKTSLLFMYSAACVCMHRCALSVLAIR